MPHPNYRLTIPERLDQSWERRGEDLIWVGGCFSTGYGRMKIKGKSKYVHRLAYQLYHHLTDEEMASIPCICHTCDTPPCFEEKHLFPGTFADNAADREQKGRGNHQGRHIHMAQEIREAYATGLVTYAMLSELYGTSESNVGNYVNARTAS